MLKVPMAPFATTALEPCSIEVSDEFTNLWRHMRMVPCQY